MPSQKKGRKGKKKEASIEIESNLYEYNKNDPILCYHGPCIYKAKVLKRTISEENQQPLYFVHYHGWNSQWDEWVAGERCLPNTPENITKMQQINKQIQINTKNHHSNNKERLVKSSTDNNNNNNKKKKRVIQDSESDDNDNENDNNIDNLIKQKNELKLKDLDDVNLNKKIKLHQAKTATSAISSATSSTTATNNSNNNNDNNINKRKLRSLKKRDKSFHEMNDKKQAMARRKFKDKLKTITIPTALKENLVYQYNLIHYDEKLIKLPKPKGFTINDILNDVMNEQKKKLEKKQQKQTPQDVDDVKAAQAINDLLPFLNNGIRGFFKNTLKLNLLYNFEKPQFDMICAEKEDQLCDIYGAEHLIRLFYILPNILMHTQGINQSNFGQIKQCISIIIQFLSKNKAKYFINFNVKDKNKNKTKLNIDDLIQDVDDEYIAKYKNISKKYESKLTL